MNIGSRIKTFRFRWDCCRRRYHGFEPRLRLLGVLE